MSIFSNSSLSRLLGLQTGNRRFVKAPALGINKHFTAGTEQYDKILGNEFEIYETTGVLKVVIVKKAMMKAAGNWKHKKKKANGEIEDLGLTPIIERLNNPNPLQSKDEFLKQLSIHRDVSGAAYIYKLEGSALNLAPSALWCIAPNEMTIKTTGKIYQQTDINDIISEFIYAEGQGVAQKIYKGDEILFRRNENTENPLAPVSPMVALSMEISNIRAAYGYRNVLLRKKGAIGILSNQASDSDGAIPLTEDERKKIEKQYQADYGISDDQMQVIITNASMNWQPMNYETKNLMLFEEVDANMKKIIDTYGLNENLFSREKASTFNNVLEAQRMAYQDTIIPESKDDAKALTQYLQMPTDEFLELDYSHLPAMKDDEVKKADILDKKTKAMATLMAQGISEEDARMITGLRQEDVEE